MPTKKSSKTIVRTGVKTSTMVALSFLAASAAFAAFAMPKRDIKMMREPVARAADLTFKDGRASIYTKGLEPGVNPSLELAALYYNNGAGGTGEHGIGYDFKKSDRTTIGSMLTLNNRRRGPYLNVESMGFRQIEESVSNVPIDAAYITLYLDSDNRVRETNENNNQITIPIGQANAITAVVPVIPGAPTPRTPAPVPAPTAPQYNTYGTLPDLRPEQFSVTSQTVSSPRIGTQIIFNSLIANRGMATARDIFFVDLLAKTPDWGQDWVGIAGFWYSAVAPEQTVSFNMPVFLSDEVLPMSTIDRTPGRSPKKYSEMTDFRFVVDTSNTIYESNETNNQSAIRNQFMR